MSRTSALLYWRKNLYWAGDTVPVILEVSNGTLRMLDGQLAPVWTVPLQGLPVARTRFGTLLIPVNGRRCAIIPVPAKFSPEPTQAQLRYGDTTDEDAADQYRAGGGIFGIGAGVAGIGTFGGSSAALGAGAAGELIGSAMQIGAYSDAVKAGNPLLAAMVQGGAVISDKGGSIIRAFVLTILGILAVALLFVLTVSILTGR